MDPAAAARTARPHPPPPRPAERIAQFLVENEARLFGRAITVAVTVGLGRGERAQDAARDLFQELCAVALRVAERYDPARSPLLHWLTGILWNLGRQAAAQARVYRPGTAEGQEEAAAFDWLASCVDEYAASPEAAAAAREELARILPRLSPAEREVLLALCDCGLDNRETAARLGVSEQAVRTRASRARRRALEIRNALDKEVGR
jgi:RNA polymerase sigma factor (sigma-70 family)